MCIAIVLHLTIWIGRVVSQSAVVAHIYKLGGFFLQQSWFLDSRSKHPLQLDEYESGHDEDECSVDEDSTDSVFEVPLIDPFLILVKGHKTATKEQEYQLLSACAPSDSQAPVRALL